MSGSNSFSFSSSLTEDWSEAWTSKSLLIRSIAMERSPTWSRVITSQKLSGDWLVSISITVWGAARSLSFSVSSLSSLANNSSKSISDSTLSLTRASQVSSISVCLSGTSYSFLRLTIPVKSFPSIVSLKSSKSLLSSMFSSTDKSPILEMTSSIRSPASSCFVTWRQRSGSNGFVQKVSGAWTDASLVWNDSLL